MLWVILPSLKHIFAPENQLEDDISFGVKGLFSVFAVSFRECSRFKAESIFQGVL